MSDINVCPHCQTKWRSTGNGGWEVVPGIMHIKTRQVPCPECTKKTEAQEDLVTIEISLFPKSLGDGWMLTSFGVVSTIGGCLWLIIGFIRLIEWVWVGTD